MQRLMCIGIILSAMFLSGCGALSPKKTTEEGLETVQAPADKVVVYVYRLVNYSGGGRTHLLQLDEKTLGRLSQTNYYRIELWPGHYFLDIFLPAEEIFGQTSLPMSSGQPLIFNPWDAGHTYLLIYEDGRGIRLEEARPESMADLKKERTLTMALSARDTARVKFFLSTRYDGPEMYGKPHGKGTLSWEDGCRYEGVFDHGQLTPEGKFFFPNGQIYMGELFWGRPKGWGVLMAPDGRALYAGAFLDEKPHGVGLRMGEEGPQYCTYEQGIDITRSIFQLAEEAVEAQEEEKMTLYLNSSEETDDPEAENADPTKDETDYQQFVERIKESHDLRLSDMIRQLSKKNKAKIDHERAWCQKEFDQDNDWCICIPFELYEPPLNSCKR